MCHPGNTFEPSALYFRKNIADAMQSGKTTSNLVPPAFVNGLQKSYHMEKLVFNDKSKSNKVFIFASIKTYSYNKKENLSLNNLQNECTC